MRIGLSNTSTQAIDNITNTINLHIGRNSASASQFYNGKMDNLRLYNRALTNSEITDLYNSELQVIFTSCQPGTLMPMVMDMEIQL